MQIEETAPETTLVIGASGIIGGGYIRHTLKRVAQQIPEQTVDGPILIGLSRQPPALPHTQYIPMAHDLMNGGDAHEIDQHPNLKDVTRAVYAGFIDGDPRTGQRENNRMLFAKALGFLRAHCPSLKHVTLMEGMKAYGTHLGPHKTPSRETDPRLPEGHYYYDQEDLLRQYAAQMGWMYTVLRPHIVLGPARRSPQNIISVLATHARMCKASGERFFFPGNEQSFTSITQATDIDLLCQAIDWAYLSEEARGGVFNITNGDVFRWCNLWPKIADFFELEAEGPRNIKLSSYWDQGKAIGMNMRGVHAHSHAISEEGQTFVSWPFADYVFSITWDVMAHLGACRKAGFHGYCDTEEVILARLEDFHF